MKRILLALLLLAAGPSHAATWFVDNSCAHNGDGSATSCASGSGSAGPWNSLAALQGACAGRVAGGDHVQIRRGTGRYNEGSGQGWTISCSGSSAGAGKPSTPIVYENYPGENVVIDGSHDIHASAWTAVGSGVYQCTAAACHPAGSNSWAYIGWWVPAGGGTEQEIYVDQSSNTCDATVPAGWMRGTGGAICVHLPDGSSPATASSFSIPFVSYGISLGNGGSHDIVLRRNPSGGSFSVRRNWFNNIVGSAFNGYNLVFDGLDLDFAIDRCLNIDNGNYPPVYPITSAPQNNVYTHNHIHHCGQEGMHVGDDTLSTIVDFNEIDHIQIPPWFQHCGNSCGPHFTDRGVAIRAWCFNPGNYCHIGGNFIHDSGGGHQWGRFGAIHLEYGALNTLVENNLISNIGPMGSSQYSPGAGGAGIQLNVWAQYPACGTASAPCTIRNNRIFNVDDCVNFEGAGNYYLNFYNNTCANFADAALTIETADGGPQTGTINVVNNIFYWSPTAGQTKGPITMMLGVAAGQCTGAGFCFNTTGVFANNAFYCSTGCSGTIVDWPSNSTYTASTITAVGGNTWGDPHLDLVATGLPLDPLGTASTYCPWNCSKVAVPNLMLTAASGSAYQMGQNLAPPFADALGTPRPASGPWDAGAVQYQTPPDFPAPAGLTIP